MTNHRSIFSPANGAAAGFRRGFTLLEVMVAAALLSFVTAAAMAAFLAQSRATNTQSSVMEANDQAREAIRLIGNDVRTAVAGVSPGGGGVAKCAPGTIPFDGAGSNPACLPPVFRSNSPMLPPGVNVPTPLTAITAVYAECPGPINAPFHPGYRLDFGNNVLVPQSTNPALPNFFCPDDLVVLAADAANPLFMVQSPPKFPSNGNLLPVTFAGTVPAPRLSTGSPPQAGLGFDEAPPSLVGTACPAPYNAILCLPMMLFGGPFGAVLMNVGPSPTLPPVYAGGNCAGGPANCNVTTYGIVPQTVGIDLLRNNLTTGTVALPAHLFKYSIQPVNASGGFTPPFVSANLVRSQVVPLTVNGLTIANDSFLVIGSTVLAEGVLDMQVEFGITAPAGNGLVYVNSGGLQSAVWASDAAGPAAPAAVPIAQAIDNCLAGITPDPSIWQGVCYPTNGSNGVNIMQRIKSVRLSLTVRSGASINTRAGAAGGATAISGLFTLQPAGMDVSGGNAEAKSWAFSAPNLAVLTGDGADYRQVSTEIYSRNL